MFRNKFIRYRLLKYFIFFCLLIVSQTWNYNLLRADTSNKNALSENNTYHLQIKITFQDPDFRTPWRRKNPSIRFALGSYIGDNLILVPASLISNHTLIEVRSLEESSAKTAELVRIDYESDLAIVRVLNPDNLFSNIAIAEFPNSIRHKIDSKAAYLSGSGELKHSPGKVDNLLMGHYPEARVDLPYLEFNSNEKISGNGELIVSTSGEIVGLLNEFNSGTGKGKIIPSRIIHHFIKEKQLFPFKGFLYRPISDKTTLKYYGLGAGETGVLVTEILIDSSAFGVLEIEDIITKVGDFLVDGKGRIDHPTYGKISFAYLFHSGQDYGYSNGKSIPVEIIRKKKKLQKNIKLKPFPESAILIPHGSPRDLIPGYMIVGGLLFIDLSEFYMKEYGRGWRSKVDKKMLYNLDYHKYRKSDKDPKRIITLVQVLPDNGNNGYHGFRQVELTRFNGEELKDLEDLKDKISKVKGDEFLKFELQDGNKAILKKKNATEIDLRIQKNYLIPRLYSPSKESISHEGVAER